MTITRSINPFSISCCANAIEQMVLPAPGAACQETLGCRTSICVKPRHGFCDGVFLPPTKFIVHLLHPSLNCIRGKAFARCLKQSCHLWCEESRDQRGSSLGVVSHIFRSTLRKWQRALDVVSERKIVSSINPIFDESYLSDRKCFGYL